jgi:hypothetical protein
MLRYFTPGTLTSVLTSTGFVPVTVQTGTTQGTVPITTPSTSANDCCCPSSTVFLETLTEKLLLMAKSLKVQFAELQSNSKGTLQQAKGAILAETKVQGKVVAKYEYVIYIQRYGPPINGKFDPVYLERIRDDLADGGSSLSSF